MPCTTTQSPKAVVHKSNATMAVTLQTVTYGVAQLLQQVLTNTSQTRQ